MVRIIIMMKMIMINNENKIHKTLFMTIMKAVKALSTNNNVINK